MIERRPFADLGGADHGWLKAHHHFSFAEYHDPDRMGWGTLRVWNDDEITPGRGFPPHPHSDMEIITYVREGAITHQDSLGNSGRTEAGDVQVMSAGSGIRHSEYNLEPVTTRLFQIWIRPTERGGSQSWGIRAPARVLGAKLMEGQSITLDLDPTRFAYLVPATGTIEVNGVRIQHRDGVAITDETSVKIVAKEDTELVLVDAL